MLDSMISGGSAFVQIVSGSLRSSFDKDYEINDDHYMLTVMAGSSFTGGHSSMYMEYLQDGDDLSSAKCYLVHLTTSGNGVVHVTYDLAQDIVDGNKLKSYTLDLGENGEMEIIPKSGKGLETKKNIRTYPVDTDQTIKFFNAVERFIGKVNTGRYYYSLPGGLLGRVNLKGKRGVNCADFIIKILNETGIGNRYNTLITMPSRVAKHR